MTEIAGWSEATDAPEARRRPFAGRVGTRAWAYAQIAGWVLFATGIAYSVVLRFWHLGQLGYNSDEAVYAGQAASLADDPELKQFFPIFRAHPLLFQSILAVGFKFGVNDVTGRAISAAFGLGTIVIVYKLGVLLYGRKAGLLASLFVALMPYHVLVSRQVLLDGPMVFFATLTLYLLALYATTKRPAWLYAAGGAMGLTVLGKETSILLLGAIYAFFALSPDIHVRMRNLAISFGVMVLVIAPFPLTLKLAGHAQTGESYLAWQLFRRPNHQWSFYPATVPAVIGPLLVFVALLGLWLLRDQISWRETLLLSWIVVPALFFQLWPVKGFQYLLPSAIPIALLAGRTIGRLKPEPAKAGSRWANWPRLVAPVLAVTVALTLAVETHARIQPSTSGTFLAGSGGVPGGRELGHWVESRVPEGAQLLAIGPSMANIVQFYGHRRAYGLSVGPNPLRRNPAYEPITNPDLAIRSNELQYLVWDAFSASRTSFFSDKLLAYADRYNGRIVHTESVITKTREGKYAKRPVIVVYEVRP
ncbi:MAG: glycosyltransferase family 39 protein [Actinomycetota bacterium]